QLPADRRRPDRRADDHARSRPRGSPDRPHPPLGTGKRRPHAQPRAGADRAGVPAPRHRPAACAAADRLRRMGPLGAGGSRPAYEDSRALARGGRASQRPEEDEGGDLKMTQTIDAVATEPRPLLLGGVPTDGSDSAPIVFPYDGSVVARVWLGGE